MKTAQILKTISVLFFTFGITALLIVSCAKDEAETPIDEPTDGNLKLALALSNAGEEVLLNEEVILSSGVKVTLSNFRLYVSNITGVLANGDEVPFGEVALLDLKEIEGADFKVPANNYASLKVGLGLSPALNSSDPSTFANENPLSSFQGMYWSMLKYRFAIMEGRVNTVSNPQPTDELLTYHTGTDVAFRELDLVYDFTVSNDQLSTVLLNLTVDLNELFDGDGGNLEPLTNSSTHSQPSQIGLTNMIMDNLKGSLFIEGIVVIE